MRKEILMMKGWEFTDKDGSVSTLDLPHTFNATDGQNGGNNYYRGKLSYRKVFDVEMPHEDEQVYLCFDGVNASAFVTLNGHAFAPHHGGYSTFRYRVDPFLREKDNELIVEADNSVNDKVYPQLADFTFYGGIYRDVKLLVVKKEHFDLDFFGSDGIKADLTVDGNEGVADITAFTEAAGSVLFSLGGLEEEAEVKDGKASARIRIKDVHLWNGKTDPFLYDLKASLMCGGEKKDEVSLRVGFRTFSIDRDKGFFLNGRPYPLHGVSKHQDRRGCGNAITREQMEEDMALIKEIGANTIRLAHYQHDRYFYDLCDREGMIVWAEIPYISKHMPSANANTESQMKELIFQNYNHPSIICWGISNEITILVKNRKDMLDNHRRLQALIKELDSSRYTTMACFSFCLPGSKITRITDLIGWNLYLGWYVPFMPLNDVAISLYHYVHKKQPLCYSEYGAEGMPDLHSSRPRRGDHTEEYQAKYHEFMLECFRRHPYLWGTYVWNMFDFAADARNQGGEPGMNHKGMVTFDRKIKKDSFYVYKAYWSDEPFVHIASKRYENRTGDMLDIKVYSNLPEITLYKNGEKIETKSGDKVFRFRVKADETNEIRAVSGEHEDSAVFRRTERPDPSYKLSKKKKRSANWV